MTTKAEEHEGHNVIMMHTLGERVKVSSEQCRGEEGFQIGSISLALHQPGILCASAAAVFWAERGTVASVTSRIDNNEVDSAR